MTKSHPSRRRALARRQAEARAELNLLDTAPGSNLTTPTLASTDPTSDSPKQILKDKKPLLALVSLFLLSGIGATLAYYSDTTFFRDADTAKTFSVRTTHESFNYTHLSPGDTFSKTYVTTNTGQIPVAVRYYYIAQWTDLEGNPIPLGFEVENENEGFHSELAVSIPANTAKITEYGTQVTPWKTEGLTDVYCADRIVVSDPEHYSCENITEDITAAYSVISGPYTYYRVVYANESTRLTPFSTFAINSALASIKTVTSEYCTLPSDTFPEGECSPIAENSISRALDGSVIKEAVYDNPYAGATFAFTLRAETIEGKYRHRVWDTGADIYNPYPDLPEDTI